jgi:hypothetical protein
VVLGVPSSDGMVGPWAATQSCDEDQRPMRIDVGTMTDMWHCPKCGPRSHLMLDISTKFGWCPDCQEDWERHEAQHVEAMAYDLRHSAGIWIYSRVVIR